MSAGSPEAELKAIPLEELLSFPLESPGRFEKAQRFYALAGEQLKTRIARTVLRHAAETFKRWVERSGLTRGGRRAETLASRGGSYGKALDRALQADRFLLRDVLRIYHSGRVKDPVRDSPINRAFVGEMEERGGSAASPPGAGNLAVAVPALRQLAPGFDAEEFALYVAALQLIAPDWFSAPGSPVAPGEAPAAPAAPLAPERSPAPGATPPPEPSPVPAKVAQPPPVVSPALAAASRPPPTSKAPSLGPEARARLRDVLRTLQTELGIGPLREAARDAGLLGKDARKADVAWLKRQVADADQLARLLAEALDDRAREASASRTLQKVAAEAAGAPTLDRRAENLFQRARRGLELGDWDQLARSLGLLHALSRDNQHPILEVSELIVAFGSGDRARVEVALLAQEALAPPPAAVEADPTLQEEGAGPADAARWLDYRAHLQARAAQLRSELLPPPLEAFEAALGTVRSRIDALSAELGSPALGSEQLLGHAEVLGAGLTETVRLAVELETRWRALVERVSSELGPLAPVEVRPALLRQLQQELLLAVERVESSCLGALDRAQELDAPGAGLPPLVEPGPTLAQAEQLLLQHEEGCRAALERRRVARNSRASSPPGGSAGSAELAFRAGSPPPGLLGTGLVGIVVGGLRRTVATGPVGFLPLRPSTPPVLLEPGPSGSSLDALNAGTANLLAAWAFAAGPDSPVRGLGQLLAFLAEADRIRACVAGDPCADELDCVVTALALHCATTDRARARGTRRVSELLAATDGTARRQLLVDCGCAASDAPGLIRVCCELVGVGLASQLASIVRESAAHQPAKARALVDAIAIAAALAPRAHGTGAREAVLVALGLLPEDRDAVNDYLADSERQSRRTTRPQLPELRSAEPLLTDFVTALGGRLWERGRAAGGEAKVGASVPPAAEKGLRILAGTRHVDVPILIRNGGDLAAGGITVVAAPITRSDPLVRGVGEELHVPWLTDRDLDETSSVVLACPLELDPERADRTTEVRLHVKATWYGGSREQTYSITIIPDARLEPAAPPPVAGFDGRPMDLNTAEVLQVSSTSVQSCFKALRDRLRAGQPVRALVYGRRRRGKSSICESLAGDPEIQQQFAVRYLAWNGARMASLAVAFSTLTKALVDALAERQIDTRAPGFADLVAVEEFSERFLHWFDSVSSKLTRPVKLLLVLDEFQKWIVGLGTKSERIALLTALRHFNDRTGKLEVAFVLSGLRNLKSLVEESADLSNAVDPYEIRELTQEEADRYLRDRVPLELDGRTRRRLTALSGGNPYVLNRLLGNLVADLTHKRRSWCTTADVEALLASDDAQSGRLAEFVKYMLHEGEDDTAPPLRQLTVLRAIASLLSERGDHAGYVRVTDVEAWLTRLRVELEPGETLRQLEELVGDGHLQPGSGGRYYLRGEWLCRQLAALDPTRVRLQPVSRSADPELVLGRYRKLRQIGRGGEAEIWLAENVQEGGREVVLRIYPRNTSGLQERLEREKKVLSQLRHPNVVGFLGGNVDERHGGVLVLDYVQGRRLEELLDGAPAEARPILPGGDLPTLVRLLERIAGAVKACHSAGVVHKDLSPRNVMVTLQLGVWEPTLIDFGLAGFETQPMDDGGTTQMGTAGYIAPEKIKLRSARRTPAADVYSLGALFIRMTSGREPGEVTRSAGTVAAALEDAGVPVRLRELIGRMVDEEPTARPGATEVVSALGTVLTPLSWRELRADAVEAWLDERPEEAVVLLGNALASVPASERGGADYCALLTEALELLAGSGGEAVPWAEQLLEQWVAAVVSGEERLSARGLLAALKTHCDQFPEAGRGAVAALVSRLRQLATRQQLVPLVSSMAHEEVFRHEAVAAETFDVLALYHAEGRLDAEYLQTFGVVCARRARVKLQQLLQAELWLQRVRRVAGESRADYREEEERLADARRRTGRMQVLPPSEPQEKIRLGAAEKAHLKVERLEAFDERVRRMFPFVVQIRRVEKDYHAKAIGPTLLGLEHVGRHIPDRTEDPGNLIPFVLDGSYTAENVAIRMNLVLSSSTTASQREAAFTLLRESGEFEPG